MPYRNAYLRWYRSGKDNDPIRDCKCLVYRIENKIGRYFVASYDPGKGWDLFGPGYTYLYTVPYEPTDIYAYLPLIMQPIYEGDEGYVWMMIKETAPENNDGRDI